MKKKNPPYAFIGAILLFAVFAFALYEWVQKQSSDKAAAVAAQQALDQKAIDDANKTHQAVTTTPTDMRAVLYATQPVEPGQRLSPAFYEKKMTPKEILPDAYSDESDITGWLAIRKLEKGDPLTPRNIGKSLPYMSQRISPGMRALSLPVFNAESNATGGFVVDGDKVDLLYTLGVNGALLSTQMVMQNLTILYVPGPAIKTDKTDGINPAPPPGDQISVTFEVTPEQAQALVLMAQAKDAKFSMILRSRRDDGQITIKPFLAADYLANLKKVQRMVDKSNDRVNELAKEIQDKEKTMQATQGNTNETTPTPPSP